MAKQLEIDRLDKHKKIIKVDGEDTSLEVSSHGNGAKVTGNLEVSGSVHINDKITSNNHLVLPNLTIDEPDANIKANGNFAFTSSGTLTFDSHGNVHQFKDENGVLMMKLQETTGHHLLTLYKSGTGSQFMVFEVDDESTSNQTIHASGNLILSPSGHLNINVGAGKHVEFDGMGVGFDLDATTYDATDTIVRFDQGNKKTLTFGAGNITDLYTRFPATSGNFTLILKQDGSGSRTVTNWKVSDSGGADASGSPIVKFAGGSNPTLTTDANHVDIISFFWDADTEIAYGVATLDFQF